jgi:hypothetical protein
VIGTPRSALVYEELHALTIETIQMWIESAKNGSLDSLSAIHALHEALYGSVCSASTSQNAANLFIDTGFTNRSS